MCSEEENIQSSESADRHKRHDCCRWQRCQELFERLHAGSCFMQALSRHQSTKHCDGFLFCYVDVGTQQHHATHHPPTPPPPTLQVRWSLLKLVGAVVALHVNQVQLASWRNMVRLIACRAVVFWLADNYKRRRDENSWHRIQTMPFQNSCVLGAVCTSWHRSPVLSRLLFKSVWNLGVTGFIWQCTCPVLGFDVQARIVAVTYCCRIE